MHRSAAACLAAILAGSWASPARAEDAAPPDASALVRQGVELRRDHRNAEALAAFQKALALSPTPLVRAQVALAEQALGRWLDAERDLAAALAATDDDWITKNRAVLEDSRGTIAQRLAWLTVDVDVTTAAVQIDGRPIPRAAEARVVAGAAVLEVLASGYSPDIRRVELAPGAHDQVTVSLSPLIAAPPSAPPPTPVAPPATSDVVPAPSAPERSLAGPLVLGAVGVAGLGLGAYFGLHTLSEKSARDSVCPGPSCATEGLSHDSNARTSAAVSTIAFVASAASLAGAVTWYLLDRKARPTRALRVGPTFGALGPGIAVEGALP